MGGSRQGMRPRPSVTSLQSGAHVESLSSRAYQLLREHGFIRWAERGSASGTRGRLHARRGTGAILEARGAVRVSVWLQAGPRANPSPTTPQGHSSGVQCHQARFGAGLLCSSGPSTQVIAFGAVIVACC